MKLIRRTVSAQPLPRPQCPFATTFYLFYEKASGTAHFHVEAGPHGELPVDHAAGLLAMHCMVRGQSPSDYLVMVPAGQENFQELTEKAQKLLEAGQSVRTSVKLTRREQEVLDGILRSLANKEIACELNLSERTVKFHVSSLLAKFKVHSRMELMREASQRAMQPLPPSVGASPAEELPSFSRSSGMAGRAFNSRKVLPLARSRMMA